MVRTFTIQFRVSKGEAERIKNKAFAKGYATVSGYLRSLTLGNDLTTEEKISAIYDRVVRGSLQETNNP